jgi:hypothetical protein
MVRPVPLSTGVYRLFGRSSLPARSYLGELYSSFDRPGLLQHLSQGIPVRDRPDLSGCLRSEGDDVGGVTEKEMGYHKPERR